MYLLHWPVISFWKILSNGHAVPVTVACLMFFGVFLAAYGIYRYVETPMRRAHSVFICAVLLVCMGGIGWIGLRVRHKCIPPYAELCFPHLRKLIEASDDWQFPTAHMHPMPQGEELYKIGQVQDVGLFFGDSNAQQYAPRIDKILSERKSSKSAVFVAGDYVLFLMWGAILKM